MKKYGVVFVGNVFSAPYLKYYLKYLDGIVELIYWDRVGNKEEVEVSKKHVFYYPTIETTKFKKIFGYLKFKRFANKILKIEMYDNIIVFPTQTGILLRKTLQKKYNKNFVIDIRDYSFERNIIYYLLLKKLLKKSKEVVISSPGFKEFLPKIAHKKFVLAHNFDEKVYDLKVNYKRNSEGRLMISYIGYVRFLPQLKKFILSFKNNSKFILKFVGRGSNKLLSFCQENMINNVVLIDYFHPDRTYEYYQEADIVFNLYGNNTPLLDYALSNKLYFAAGFKKPIIVCPDTYMEKISKKYNFGITVDLENENAAELLLENYRNINVIEFNNGCETFIKNVKIENDRFINMIKSL